MLRTIDLDMPFKGERDYLHGTSMYSETIKTLRSVFKNTISGPFKLAIHRKAEFACRLVYEIFPGSNERPEEYIAEASFICGDKEFKAWLVETDKAVKRRTIYPEFKIEEKCIRQEATIKLSGSTGLSPIEELIGMTKILHNEIYPPMNFKWFFASLELKRLLEADLSGKLEVSLEGNLGNRLTRSKINYSDTSLGRIFFSRVGQ